MLVTIEPHPMVRLPGRWGVLRGGLPVNKQGKKVESNTVKLVFADDNYFRAKPELNKKEEKERRKKPLSLLAAENAVTVARYSGADLNAPELYNEARVSLEKVRDAWKSNLKEKDIELLASKTLQLAVDAERRATETVAEDIRLVEVSKRNREFEETKDALKNAEGQLDLLKEQLARVTEQKNNLQRDFDAKFTQSDRLESENKVLREENLNLKVEIKKLSEELQVTRAKVNFLKDLPNLENLLKVYGKVRKEENGLMLILNEDIWLDAESTEIDEERALDLEPLFKIVADTKYFQILIFCSTTAGEDGTSSLSFAEERAKRLEEWVAKRGVEKLRAKTQVRVQDGAPAAKKSKSRRQNKTEMLLTLVD